PFWAVYFALALWPSKPWIRRRKVSGLGILIAAAVVLMIAARYGAARGDTQALFTRLDAHAEELQRMRASYNWISIWWLQWICHYAILYAATVLAYWRVRTHVPQALRFFLIGLPLLGMLSMPA